MKKEKVKRGVLKATTVVILISLIITLFSFIRSITALTSDTISIIVSSIESIGLVASLFVAVKQLNDSKEIARADFLVELNNSFVNNPGNMELYTALQNCLDNKCEYKKDCQKNVCVIDLPKVVVSNYLTFFETIYLLLRNGVITFEMIDDLFAYRFFLAVHSTFVQQEKLAPQPENFKNIFCLEYKWLEYREKVAEKEGHKEDHKERKSDVYNQLPLKDLMVKAGLEDIYNKWIEEA